MALDLPSRPALGRADFFVSEPNRLALAQVDAWPGWPSGRLAVAGPPGAGKTHLAHVWAARSAARILPAEALPTLDLAAGVSDALAVEDVDRLADLAPAERRAAEEALFHLCNRLAAGGGSLMVSGRAAPARWRLDLPDLASRLAVAPVATLAPPDDALLAAVLVKLFADRGVGVAPPVIRFLVARIDRSFEAAEAVVARLDRAGLARGRPITVPLAAEALAAPE
ncbi:DnaA/Hda family protein [Amaricoccus sp.]|uniref:HdaA/DnaA family protein n=1 Tax=Amaricoccus sp. TaxID=1872485 RepID=UPI001B609328|nr:DnaA/Hda family protein [Amaricoccus sp.]MBP7002899.1 chromosomal replication initiator DnaA [Amaricoccus sp.]